MAIATKNLFRHNTQRGGLILPLTSVSKETLYQNKQKSQHITLNLMVLKRRLFVLIQFIERDTIMNENKIYGYARISTSKQNIDRQIRNIKNEYPTAIIYQEVFTGTKTLSRKKWQQLLKIVRTGDTIVFDSVSRMSRDADSGIQLYLELFDKGINLVFIKEHYIDTDTYRKAITESINTTGNEIADIYIEATNKVIKLLATKQIRQAFEQAEKEVTDLHQRTKEGIETARLAGKQIGLKKGTKLTTQKSIVTKEKILTYSKDFHGTLNDTDCIKLLGVARNTFYKYKAELKEN